MKKLTEGASGWLAKLVGRRDSPAELLAENAAPRIAIVTDSAAALPRDFASASLEVLTLPIMVDGEIYAEGEEELSTALSLALASGKDVKTSRPSPGQFERVYQSLADRGFQAILSIHLSAELSGTVDSAKLAAKRIAIPVEVMDSRTVAMAQGFGVRAALQAAERGDSLDAAVLAAHAALDSSKVFFYVPSLEQLRRGGRIGAAASWIGTMLAIKPILSVADGQIVPLERIRSAPKAISRLDELVAAELAVRGQPSSVAIHSFGNREQAEELLIRLQALAVPPAESFITEVPPVLGAHVGLGVLAVVISARLPA
ncbi:DegV family protein [Psychromicrobium sp. YIM B11713]|uniref:DegV family protein n=1 Tax=Psychromicrobium sp. YIM B11713 TaxID=3145233 RepID=UPI00374EBF10